MLIRMHSFISWRSQQRASLQPGVKRPFQLRWRGFEVEGHMITSSPYRESPYAAPPEDAPPGFGPLMKEYEVDPEPIGAGAFGTVHFALRNGTSKMVAIKAVSKSRTKAEAEKGAQADWQQLIRHEIELMRDLSATRHRNMCAAARARRSPCARPRGHAADARLLRSPHRRPRFYGDWEDDMYVYLVLQLCRTEWKEPSPLPEQARAPCACARPAPPKAPLAPTTDA